MNFSDTGGLTFADPALVSAEPVIVQPVLLASYDVDGMRNHDFTGLGGWDELHLKFTGTILNDNYDIKFFFGDGALITGGYHFRRVMASDSSWPDNHSVSDYAYAVLMNNKPNVNDPGSIEMKIKLRAGHAEAATISRSLRSTKVYENTYSLYKKQAGLSSCHIDLGDAGAWSGEIVLLGVKYGSV